MFRSPAGLRRPRNDDHLVESGRRALPIGGCLNDRLQLQEFGEGGRGRPRRAYRWLMDTANRNGHPASRFRDLPRREVLGAHYPVATTRTVRLLGLALLDRDDAGPGLLIPGCRSVHTFGMRFAIDIWFLGLYGEPLDVRRALRRSRIVRHAEARAVLEVPT